MIRRPVLVAVLATLVLLPGLVQAQPRLAVKPGIVLGDGTLILVDPARKEVTSSFPFPTNQAARGVAASGGFAYVGMWTDNGIQRVDLNNGKWETIVKDSTNQVLGAPYQPVIDNGAIGGPGLVVVDGNPPPAPFTGRNLATIDIRNRSFALDSVFPSIHLPMSDAFADPYIPDEIIGVGFSTSDQNVISIPISRKAQNVTPQVITRLKQPCLYDALIHENQKLYSWSSSPSFVGFECVDLDRLNSSQLIPVTGITHTGTGYGAWWNDPHENPGRKVFGVLDGNDTLYEVDLAQNPAPATAIKTTPGLPSSTYTTGRSIEEAELTSWRLGPGSRNFHLDFGPAHGGRSTSSCPA